MKNKGEKDTLKTLKDDIKNTLTVSEVFERYYYPLRKVKDGTYTSVCPFHNDKKDGNFHISDSKNIYKCFVCGASGDVLSLVKERYNCSFVDSVYILAKDFGYISESDYEKRDIKFDENYEITKRKKLSKKIENIDTNEAKLANQKTIEKVYDIFADLAGISKSDYDYLKNIRKLDEESIKSTYFTMPRCTQGFMRKLNNELEKINLLEDDLIGVPGFYFDEEKNKIVFSGAKGIGIKVKDYNGATNRIQIRFTNKKVDKSTGKEMRYSWFSSAKKNKGCSSGSPVDVSYPLIDYDKMKAIVFITEGKFKSERINQKFNSVSLSVQGITSWKDKILSQIEGVSQKVNLKGIYMCYDADMSINLQVYQQCKAMIEQEIGDYFPRKNIFMVTWDANLGKGIDDLIDNGNEKFIKKIEFDKYVELFENLLNTYGKNDKNELIDLKTNELITKEKLYEDYMTKVFPKI